LFGLLCAWRKVQILRQHNQRLDLGLGHRRPDPRRPRVRDASRLRRHLTGRVWAGSNVAQGFDAHALEECGAERRR
jgi:hypothetical protein